MGMVVCSLAEGSLPVWSGHRAGLHMHRSLLLMEPGSCVWGAPWFSAGFWGQWSGPESAQALRTNL